MKLIRFLFIIPALPLALCCWVIKLLGIFAVSMTGWIFNALASFMFMMGLACLLFAVAEFDEVLPLWIGAFAVFVVPYIASTIVAVFGLMSTILREFIFG